MNIAQTYLNLLSCTNESVLEEKISKMSEFDKNIFIKTAIQLFQGQRADENDLIQFVQEQIDAKTFR